MIIAQLSDPHIGVPGTLLYGRVDTADFLARAAAEITQLEPRPDIVVLTGDLVAIGEPAEYDHLRRILAPLPMPLFVIPGNHDAREPLRAAFGGDGYLPPEGFIQYVVEDYPLRLVALDTHIPRSSAGELCEERLAWLEKTLAAERGKPTFLFGHHPPFICGIGHMDKIRLIAGAERLEAIVRANPQVRAIAFGHHHRPIETLFGGALASIAPGVAHQVELDLRDGEPEGQMNLEPPAYRLWRWDGQRLISHMAYVERFPGPYPFVED
jgi:3',5'-cyclic-AMP phosphodiesterase